MLNDHVLTPLAGGKPSFAVILLHGLGDSGAGLIDLGTAWRQGFPDTEFVAPDAPYPCDMAPFGFQWFSLQDRSPTALMDGVRRAAPILDDYIDHIMKSRDLPAERVALVGFSQGSMMSLYVAPRRSPALAGVVAYSGALIGGETLRQQRQSAPTVLLIHGMNDEVVPFEAMEQAERGLQSVNINATGIARPGLGHSIDDVGLWEGGRFLRRVFETALHAPVPLG